MVSLTFGEQVKILLSRKNMTIKELAGLIQERTGMKMSRQNLTQRLGRDNFQEQDMRMIADILECPFWLNILDTEEMPKTWVPEAKELNTEIQSAAEKELKKEVTPETGVHIEVTEAAGNETGKETDKISIKEREVTIGELADLYMDEPSLLSSVIPEIQEEMAAEDETEKNVEKTESVKDEKPQEDTVKNVLPSSAAEELKHSEQEKKDRKERNGTSAKSGQDKILGDTNPYTGKEYESNSVRMHAKRIGYVQVYDRGEHKWTDMTEWAFLGYQERKKVLLGKAYTPPIYLD